jgi:tetratricopeptide (TPR) repeat protein
MKVFKNILAGVMSLGLIALFVTIYGCTSAETTTGKLAFQQKDFDKAAIELAKGLQIDKQDSEGWYMLGVSLIQVGINSGDYSKLPEGKKAIDEALKLNPGYGDEVLAFWGLNFNSAVNYFNEGAKSVNQGDTLGAKRNFDRALLYSTAAVNIIPDSLEGFRIMGDIKYINGSSDEAVKIYETVFEKSKSSADASILAKYYYEKGLKHRQAEQYDDAIKMFGKALEIPGIAKDNKYYEFSAFNMGISYYQKASKIALENSGDYKPLLVECVKYLEPLSKTAKDKGLLKDVYEFLVNAYDALGDDAKKEEANKKKLELQ